MELFTEAPSGLYVPPSDLVIPQQPGEEVLFDYYKERVPQLGPFKQLDFSDARNNFVRTVIDTSAIPAELLYDTLYKIVDRDSYDEFKSALTEYWKKYGFEELLATHSIAFISAHRLFTDVPLEIFTIYDMRQTDPFAAQRSVESVSRMIPTMAVDLSNEGSYTEVTPLLGAFSLQIQTVPHYDGENEDAKKLQEKWNNEGKMALGQVSHHSGYIETMAASGTHDDEDGTMHRVNPATAKLLKEGNLIVVPLYFSCMPFSGNHLDPAPIKFRFLEPRILNHSWEVHDMMHEIALAGSEILIDELPKGFPYEGPRSKQFKRVGQEAVARFMQLAA